MSKVVLLADEMELRPLNRSSIFLLNSIYQTFIVHLLCAQGCAGSNCVICHLV